MPETAPTPPPQGDPRGEATREALVRAAIELFGLHGYHATSNRALADAAQVNAALIGYHFGGKRGLYLAAFQAIAHGMGRRLGSVIESTEAELAALEEDGRADVEERLLPLLDRLLDGFVAMMTAEESGPWARLIVREQADPSEALDILLRGPIGHLASLVIRLVHAIEEPGTGPASGAAATRARILALTIMGQALIFRVARATALHLLGWSEIGPRDVALIQRQVRENARSILRKGRPT